MNKKRILTDDEIHKIRHEEDMLQGNINRMCVADDSEELLTMLYFAHLRLNTIYKICRNKFTEESDEE